MSIRSRKFVLSWASLMLMIIALSCGESWTARVVFRADFSVLPNDNPDDLATDLQEVMLARANAWGGAVEINFNGKDRLTVTSSEIGGDQIVQLLGDKIVVEFKEPRRGGVGYTVVCRIAEGDSFAVPVEQMLSVPKTTGEIQTRCADDKGRNGEVVWDIAGGKDSLGRPLIFSQNSIAPGGATISDSPRLGLALAFTESGAEVLASLSERLSGSRLPLAIFVDNKPIFTFRMLRTIREGRLVVRDLQPGQARLLAAQINGGRLVVPLEAVSVEQR